MGLLIVMIQPLQANSQSLPCPWQLHCQQGHEGEQARCSGYQQHSWSDAWGHEESDSQEANGLLAWEQRAELLKPTTLDGNLEKSGQGQECG